MANSENPVPARQARFGGSTAVQIARRLRRADGKLLVGGAMLGVLIALSLLAPFIIPYDPVALDITSRLQPPSTAHWLGTDEYGRDVLSRILMGGKLSLGLGFAATAVSLLLGVPLGLWAGYRGGRYEELILRGCDVLMSFPPIMLGLLILAVTPPAMWKLIIAVGIVYVPATVRLTRAVTLEIVSEEFILAARVRGERNSYILLKEILPNAMAPIVVEASLRVTFAILLGAALSFIGLGAQPPSSDWGLMISEARPLLDSAPWIALAPGCAMGLTVIAVNLLGDGLRATFDPKLRRHN